MCKKQPQTHPQLLYHKVWSLLSLCFFLLSWCQGCDVSGTAESCNSEQPARKADSFSSWTCNFCCAFHLARSKDSRCPWAPLSTHPCRLLSVHIGTHLGSAIELMVSQLFLTPAHHHSGESEKGGVLPEPQLEKAWLGLTASPDLVYGSSPSPLCRAKNQSFQPSWKQKTGGKPPVWLIGSHTKVLLHNLSPGISAVRELQAQGSAFWGTGRDHLPISGCKARQV